MSATFKFHVTGKSNLVYVAFFNNNFEKNLTKVNPDEFDLSEFHSENEVESCIPGNGLELDGIELIKVFKNDELIYEDNSLQDLDSVNDGENLDPIKGSIMIVYNNCLCLLYTNPEKNLCTFICVLSGITHYHHNNKK